jgi:2-oxoacid:acceptor oxidoreductase delta subunit (pyruvate/2-ketoisovalerate family)
MARFVARRVPPGSSLKNLTQAWRGKHPVFLQDKCIGCQRCFMGCPEGTIYQLEKKKFDVNLDYCKGCGICAHECPVDDIEMVLETGCEEPVASGGRSGSDSK